MKNKWKVLEEMYQMDEVYITEKDNITLWVSTDDNSLVATYDHVTKELCLHQFIG